MPQPRRDADERSVPSALFFGMLGAYSLAVLRALLDSGVVVRAVVVPAAPGEPGRPAVRNEPRYLIARSTLPLLTPFASESVVTLAWERRIPVWSLSGEGDPTALDTLSAFGADVLIAACWPRRLPATLLALAPRGALNVHPSLLPAHRGPAPLFWTLRHGDSQAGVSIHLLDETLDGGPLLAQTPVAIQEGIAGDELEWRCAEEGGRLLVRTLGDLRDAMAHPLAQDERRATYEGWPAPEDFVVTPDRSARWAFTFIRGAAYWGGPMVIRVGARLFTVAAALDYAPDDVGQPGLVRRAGDGLWLACTPGTLHVQIG